MKRGALSARLAAILNASILLNDQAKPTLKKVGFLLRGNKWAILVFWLWQ